MASDKAKAPNKSAEIRKALGQYPNKGPAEIARLLTKQLGVQVSPKHVSSMKAKERQQAGQAAQPQPVAAAARKLPAPRPPAARAAASEGGVAEIVATLQGYIQRLGKKDLGRLIDRL